MAAVGVLVFGLAKFVYGILHYYFRERQPIREFRHPAYGLLTGEGDLWSGTAQAEGRQVRFTVSGTEAAPKDSEMQRLAAVIGKFSEIHVEAINFLRAKEPDLANAVFEVYELEIDACPDCFTISFVADKDDSRIWGVVYEAGKPTSTGFDD